MPATRPTLEHEIELWKQGYTVIGIDEVGRGALSGPVYVSGVAFTPTTDTAALDELCSLGINDSKKLSALKRTKIAQILSERKVLSVTASSSCEIINSQGIISALNNAILQVTQKMSEQLPQKKIFVLLDGLNDPHKNASTDISYRNIIRGDSISLSIAAASIIAKVARDSYMETLHEEYPMYAWQKNKGYGTADHIAAIKSYGACPQHRILYLRNIMSTLEKDHVSQG